MPVEKCHKVAGILWLFWDWVATLPFWGENGIGNFLDFGLGHELSQIFTDYGP